MNTQADPLKTLSYYTYIYLKPLIMSTTQETTVHNFVFAFLQGTNMSQLPPQLLVGLRSQLVTQDWVTHDYSTTTDYTFDCEKFKEIATFFRTIHNNFLDTTAQLSECYLIVLYLYNFYVLSHTRLSMLPLFQDCIQHTKMVQVSQDFVYHKNMTSNQSKCTYILYYILTRHFILLLYLGAKCCTEQIENRTVIFH